MWDYGNLQAALFKINTQNTAFNELSAHTSQLLLVGVYQQAEAFLNGFRDELKAMGQSWPQRSNHTPLLDYTLQNLPGGFGGNKIKLGEERYHLFDYYRLMRNAFVHTATDRKKLVTHFKDVASYKKMVTSKFHLDAPNRFDLLSFDDYLLFTRLVKYIATDICRIAEPSDADLLKLIECKDGTAVGQPLIRFLSYRPAESLLRQKILNHFSTRYRLDLRVRPKALDDLVQYVKTFPNKKVRRKHKKRRDQLM